MIDEGVLGKDRRKTLILAERTLIRYCYLICIKDVEFDTWVGRAVFRSYLPFCPSLVLGGSVKTSSEGVMIWLVR